MSKSPEELAHQEWIGYVQPVGLVVSIPAMLEAQCYVNKNIMAEHARFLSCVTDDNNASPQRQQTPHAADHSRALRACIRDLAEFTQKVLGWEAADLLEVSPRGPLSGDMATLEVVLPQYNETLRPTHAVPVFKPGEGQNPWMMLVQELASGTELDSTTESDSARHWNAAPQAKFERLLRETGIPIGLLSNRRQLRLVYAPKGESSGHATFNVDEMTQVAGRPMFAALHMLLCADRMFSLGDNQRLPAILENSRKYQNTVSTKLAEQVLAALYELMRGFQAANDVRNGDLLREVLANNPNHVYSGLLTVLMRLVFVMYAEDRNLLSSDPIYSNYYSVTGLFNRLREDAGRHPDTMHQRYGAWSQLITLFRLIYEGGQHGDFKLPARKGYLFDPDRYPFLEGRTSQPQGASPGSHALTTGASALRLASPIPRVSDGVIYNVLRNLLILDGERLSYRTLDVEQIGSVYETVMGFNLEVARGRSIAIKPVKTHGAPATINLDELLATSGKDRAKWLKEQSDQSLGKEAAKLLKDAETIDQLLTALDKKIQKKVTPRVVPAGAIVLQPSDERRRSGSHYTPRSLTEPIVRTTLEPILKQLITHPSQPQASQPQGASPGSSASGEPGLAPRGWQVEPQPIAKELRKRLTAGEIAGRERLEQQRVDHHTAAIRIGTPHPSQILDLKICDPAMGSGAFLVEACRQLGDHLIDAWAAHDLTPTDIPADEDEVLYARRLVAQRCLYGVDKNDMAVDLAKLSLWLVTLAKDHPFTFLDHSLRHGDSLVGLSRQQIIGFHWEPKKQKQFGEELIQKRLDRATEARAKILNAREDVPYRDQERRMALAEEALSVVRLTADACVSAFFSGSKKKDREACCEQLFDDVALHYQNLKDGRFDPHVRDRIAQAAASLRTGDHPLPPFHWEIEFPEVFSRGNRGFDAFVGNPPFAGHITLAAGNRDSYSDYLRGKFLGSGGKCDLVAFFFRNAFTLLRSGGSFGLVGTNSIRQGATRASGLGMICKTGGRIYSATRRLRWPGVAAVVVSIVHVIRDLSAGSITLDGKAADRITSFLFSVGPETDPQPLSNEGVYCLQGAVLRGNGFVFAEDKDPPNSLADLHRITTEDSKYKAVCRPIINTSDIYGGPYIDQSKIAIDLSDFDYEQAARYPLFMDILKQTVAKERSASTAKSSGDAAASKYWLYSHPATPLFEAARKFKRVIAIAKTSETQAFVFVDPEWLLSQSLIVFPSDSISLLAVLQSRCHLEWASFFSSSFKDDARYTPSECLVTFAFPVHWESNRQCAEAGENFILHREQVMERFQEGLTSLFNRFHDPDEKSAEIQKLRDLHAAMDRAVLKAYGWHDLAESAHCEFLLDYEEEDDGEPTGASPGSPRRSKRKKPWRLRWPDDFRDEVLARLLELNEQRHKEELLVASSRLPTGKKTTMNRNAKRNSSKAARGENLPLLDASDRGESNNDT